MSEGISDHKVMDRAHAKMVLLLIDQRLDSEAPAWLSGMPSKAVSAIADLLADGFDDDGYPDPAVLDLAYAIDGALSLNER